MARIAHNSNDGLRTCWVRRERQPAPDRVLVGKETPRQRFVDDRYLRRLGAILRRELSSGAHLQAHRLKVIAADEIDFSHWLFPRLERRTPFDLMKRHAESHPGERKETGQAGGLDSWQCLDAREQFLVISSALWRTQRILGQAGREFECQYAIRIETFRNR